MCRSPPTGRPSGVPGDWNCGWRRSTELGAETTNTGHACDVALSALAKGKHLRLEYKINSVSIIVTDSRGAKQVSRLKWK